MYDQISTDTDLVVIQADLRKRRIIDRAAESERRQHTTLSLKAQMEASRIHRARQRREWAQAGMWIFAFCMSVVVLTALVVFGPW